MMEYSLLHPQRVKMGISAAIAEKEIFNRLAVRTITRWDVLPGEAAEARWLQTLGRIWRNLSPE